MRLSHKTLYVEDLGVRLGGDLWIGQCIKCGRIMYAALPDVRSLIRPVRHESTITIKPKKGDRTDG